MTRPRVLHFTEDPAYQRAECGRLHHGHATPDPSLVTCQRCELYIERQLESPEDEAKRRAAPRAKAIAYQRALAQLRDLHPDEFHQLARRALRDAYPSVLAEELRLVGYLRARQ